MGSHSGKMSYRQLVLKFELVWEPFDSRCRKTPLPNNWMQEFVTLTWGLLESRRTPTPPGCTFTTGCTRTATWRYFCFSTQRAQQAVTIAISVSAIVIRVLWRSSMSGRRSIPERSSSWSCPTSKGLIQRPRSSSTSISSSSSRLCLEEDSYTEEYGADGFTPYVIINAVNDITSHWSRQVIPTLRSCWDQGTNVIVSYDYPTYHHTEMWTKIPYFYADSMSPADVESKLCQVLEQARPSHCEFLLFPIFQQHRSAVLLSFTFPTTCRFLRLWPEPHVTTWYQDPEVRPSPLR